MNGGQRCHVKESFQREVGHFGYFRLAPNGRSGGFLKRSDACVAGKLFGRSDSFKLAGGDDHMKSGDFTYAGYRCGPVELDTDGFILLNHKINLLFNLG